MPPIRAWTLRLGRHQHQRKVDTCCLFSNKMDTKRFGDPSENLILWLKRLKRQKELSQQTNLRKRKELLSEQFTEWERDITRHTYRSKLKGKDVKSIVLTYICGYTMAPTFKQHNRNARTAK